MPKNKRHSNGTKWKKERNYWKITSKAGNINYIISVDGIHVEVSEEVYMAYSQMDRHARYIEDEKDAGRILSLEKILEDEMQPTYVGAETIPDVEEAYLTRDDAGKYQKQIERLREAVASLNESDRELIYALFVQRISARQYAKTLGVSDMAIRKRRDRVLKKIKKFLQK